VSARLQARIVATALIRRAGQEGGSATVLKTGDDQSGSIMLQCNEKGQFIAFVERLLDLDGGYAWSRAGPDRSTKMAEIQEYVDRRTRNDPDLWVIELDIPEPERFAAETIP